MKIVSQMLIFDVDGVITNPQEKKITQPVILDEIIKRLKREEPVALNTGRSIEWVKDRVLKPLIEKIKDKKYFKIYWQSERKVEHGRNLIIKTI